MQFNDDPECFMGHRTHKVSLIITLSLLLTILFFIYVVYIRISITAVSQRRKVNIQRSRSSLSSAKNIKSVHQGRAGVFILILLTVLTITWILFIVLQIYDLRVHQNSDENIIRGLKNHNCSGEKQFPVDFPRLR